MYRIIFYKSINGREPVYDYILALRKNLSKDNRIKLNKINDYIEALSIYGTRLNGNYIKHIDGDIWELRPIKDRIMFAVIYEEEFVLLHCFTKKTQKTPRREIERAKREAEDYIRRRDK